MPNTTTRQDFLAFTGDLDLMTDLGLRTDIPFDRDWTHLGSIDTDAGEIEVEVSDVGSLFWRLTIIRADGWTTTDRFVMTTGSGTLGQYLPVAERILNGEKPPRRTCMINVKRI
jgi:hypothetical protein